MLLLLIGLWVFPFIVCAISFYLGEKLAIGHPTTLWDLFPECPYLTLCQYQSGGRNLAIVYGLKKKKWPGEDIAIYIACDEILPKKFSTVIAGNRWSGRTLEVRAIG